MNSVLKNSRNIAIGYFAIFLPISLLILGAIFQWGDELGDILIQRFGAVNGLYMRPIAIAMIPIAIFTVLSLPTFEKFNQFMWFSRYTKDQINYIYKSYIYSLGSFAIFSLVVVLITLFAYSENGINWQNSKDYLVIYLLFVLVVTPIFHVIKASRTIIRG